MRLINIGVNTNLIANVQLQLSRFLMLDLRALNISRDSPVQPILAKL